MHILLIDDSSSTRSLLRTLINADKSAKHEISEAASGEESLQKVGSGEINIPDLIIVDINMGGMSGYELCKEFREKHAKSDISPYIIVVTANEGVDVINQALDSGANDYMPKPVNVKILQVRLRVAERLLSHGSGSSGPLPRKTGALPEPEKAPAAPAPSAPAAQTAPSDPATDREKYISAVIESADAPIVVLDVAGPQPSFSITYANFAMSSTTQFSQEQLAGKSLAELEAWTPEFLSMVMDYVAKGSIVSHVPLWSHTRQAVPVHLSFYPVRGGDGSLNEYLVVHHF